MMGEYLQEQYFLRDERKMNISIDWVILQGLVCLLKLEQNKSTEEVETRYIKTMIKLLEETSKSIGGWG